MAKPVLKGGLNYQYISLKNRVPLDHFNQRNLMQPNYFRSTKRRKDSRS
jgi:hypothetical protein